MAVAFKIMDMDRMMVNGVNDNLGLLENRKVGERFYVSNGKLYVVKSIFERIRYFFFRSIIQRQVKDVINGVVKQLPADHKNLTELFYEKLNRLSEYVFDRSVIPDAIIEQLHPNRFDDDYAGKIEQIRFAQKLGVDFQLIDEGASGSYFGRDYKGNNLVVFKPSDETSGSINTPKFTKRVAVWIQKKIPFFRSHQFIESKKMHRSEVLAYEIDQALAFNIVPETKIETFESKRFHGKDEKEGSCQLFVENAKPALEHYKLIDTRLTLVQKLQIKFSNKRISPVSNDQLQNLAVFDFILGNQDRHFKNWLIEDGIVAIDNGASFPTKYPKNYLSLRHMYLWKWLPQAKETYLKEVNLKALKDILKGQGALTQERVKVLEAAIAQRKSIAYLGGIRTEKEFAKAKLELGILQTALSVE